MKKLKEIKRDGIVLNRMYVGDYLSTNLGHEVINMYQADNRFYYLYLNATGDYVKDHAGKIGYMLLVKYHKAGVIEVLGLAKDLKDVFDANLKQANIYEENKELSKSQNDFIKKEGGITYGGVSILDIFSKSEQQNVYITFKAESLYVPKKGIQLFIHFADECQEGKKMKAVREPYVDTSIEGKVDIFLCAYKQAKASLKQYMYPEGTFSGDKDNIEGTKKDYELIMNKLISNMGFWKKSKNRVDLNLSESDVPVRPISLFDICQIQTNENIFSNALSYFMLKTEYRKLWVNFFRDICKIELQENYTVTREENCKIEDNSEKWNNKADGGRIDLLIRDENTLLAIENKIESDINRIETDSVEGQLLRYWYYLQWRSNVAEKQYKKKKAVKVMVLSPKYNIPHIDKKMAKKWHVYTYEDLYNYLNKHKRVFKDDINFIFFFDALKRHTYSNINDYLYYEMQELFFRRIKEHQSK